MTSVDQQQGLATARRPAAARLTLSVVIPCLNEAETIEECVRRARAVMESNAIAGEVVVADNGSTDGSAELAEAAGARVVHEPRRGYGSAYLAGFAAAKGTYVIMADADLTYDFNEIPNFLALLDQGADMVIGNRMDNIHPGAMPWLHRYVGNPVLSGFLNLLYRTGVRDAHCGMRGLRRDVLPRLALRTPGMEFASEMVIRAAKEKLDIRQVPIEYHPRGGESKLSTWRDGWRHLRFLLLHSPVHLFIIPGLVMAGLGILILALSLAQLSVFGRTWQIHSMIAGSLLSIVGTQTVALGVCARTYAAMYMGDRWKLLDRYDGRLRLEHGLLAGLSVAGVGLALIVYIVAVWANRGFGSLGEERIADLAATLVVVGMEIVFASCLLSIIALRREDR
jgi:glycosyltransferase involved in cell wall biosynthesis